MPGTSSRLRPQLLAIHPKHAEPSRSRTWIAWEIGGRRRSDPGLGCCHNTLQVCPAYCVVLVRTSTDSHSLHTVFTARSLVKQPQSHELCNPYGFSHAQVSNRPLPILPFTAILNLAIKEQPDVTSRQSNSFALVCNWLITCTCATSRAHM